uniref:Odorant receptor n=1 Tax=Plutella xylostella TaxID=51655 RepID=A0A6M3YX24_PLUXY|nr:odorant receptor 50 [Plutella xylostella]
MVEPLSKAFDNNVWFWKIFAVWIQEVGNKYYKCYAVIFLISLYFLYDGLLVLNLIYTPRHIETFVPELIFFVTEMAVLFKVHLLLFKSKSIQKAFEMLDCETFTGDTEHQIETNKRFKSLYKKYFLIYFWVCQICYVSIVLIPLFIYFINGNELHLPICNYYFLSEENRDNNILSWFSYQAIADYVHMTYNYTVDTFISGLIMMGLAQFKVLNVKLAMIKSSMDKNDLPESKLDAKMHQDLIKCIKHYALLREYCQIIENIFGTSMFFQFGVGVLSNCITLYAFLLPYFESQLIFLTTYASAMTMEIFLPGYLGTLLHYESAEIGRAVYQCDWIERSESFKRSMRLLVERSKTPIELTALKIFPLSVTTFIAIMKTAYSSFTLLRVVHNRESSDYN